MKIKFLFSLVILFPTIFGFCETSFSQAKIDAFKIETSTVLEDLKALKSTNPKISPADLAAAGNDLLAKKGLNFAFSFDETTCQKIKDAKLKQKNPNLPVALNAHLNSVEGETTDVVLPPVNFSSSACGKCLVNLPLLEITDTTFITIIQDQNIKFFKPTNFTAEEVVLVDAKSLDSKLRSWKVPFSSVPIGLSEDAKQIYLDLPFSELKDLTLLIFDNGGFQFYAKSDVDVPQKQIPSKDLPKLGANPNESVIGFKNGEQTHILRLNKICN